MENESDKLKSYIDRIDKLQEAQKAISEEMLEIKKVIRAEWYKKTIAKGSDNHPLIEDFTPSKDPIFEEETTETFIETIHKKYQSSLEPIVSAQTQNTKSDLDQEDPPVKDSKPSFNWEKFVGENLISKLGVLIILIGVVIGAKYSIENDLINPTTRIALGYLSGLVMLCAGIWSKAKYTNYSAVLVSGAMAIMFFITFFAYSFYQLISMEVAFGLMVLFTIFTVIAALKYNRQVIAIIGLVGAYAVPFLLSNDSGAYEIFFAYITLVNIGILFIAFKMDWKYLYYITFTLTWLIYLSWFGFNAGDSSNYNIAFVFLTVFFVLFYALILAYKLFHSDSIDVGEVIFLFVNASIFFLAGYLLLEDSSHEGFQGLFTLGNGVIHFVVASFVYKRVGAKGDMFYLLAILVLVFITITIPIQLEGNVVSILWIAEASILFWVGRTKRIDVIECFSYPLIVLASLSVVNSWSHGYGSYVPHYGLINHLDESSLTPIFNSYFLTSIIAAIGFGWMWKVNSDNSLINRKILGYPVSQLLSVVFAFLSIFLIYMTFKNEITTYWNIKYLINMEVVRSSNKVANLYNYAHDMSRFKNVWLIIYTMLFLTGVSWLTMSKVRHYLVGRINIGFNAISIFIFLSSGLLILSELRSSYLDPDGFLLGHMSIVIRYLAILSAGVLMYITYKYQQQQFIDFKLQKYFSIFFHICLLWTITSEYIHWADIFGMDANYKLSLSILWGIYSVILVSYGIWRNRKHLRIMAIALFAVTLVKLFVYDIAHLNTISKTIVFVSLGVLLLIISFLYNKYTIRINDED